MILAHRNLRKSIYINNLGKGRAAPPRRNSLRRNGLGQFLNNLSTIVYMKINITISVNSNSPKKDKKNPATLRG